MVEHDMPSESSNASERREHLSALVDGELEGEQVAQACTHWRDDDEARSTWHAYQLIGDVLRSEDLASRPLHDSAFLARLRERLAVEPVVLAPAPALQTFAPARSRRWGWMAPAAAVAGFVAVAGVVTVMRGTDPGGAAREASVIAQSGASAPVLRAEPAAETVVFTGAMIRDVRLDRYLAAHQQFAGSSALGVPSAFLRSATADGSGR
jgi:sigma-E factor negative regulatory protein RseA